MALALDQGVGALRGRITDVIRIQQQPLHVFLAVKRPARLAEAVEKAFGKIVRRRHRFGAMNLVAVDHAEIGQRAAIVDIDKQSPPRGRRNSVAFPEAVFSVKSVHEDAPGAGGTETTTHWLGWG